MAIIPSIPSVQAEVRINGEQATEYADSFELYEDNTTVRYIEAVSGARFTIHCKVWHPYDIQGRDIRAMIWVDGKRIPGKAFPYETYKERQGEMNVERFKSFKDGQSTMAPMVFSELDVDEDSEDISSRKLHKKVTSMGDIRIEIVRGQATIKNPREITTTIDEIGKISEKDLKGRALSHQVKLQASEPTKQANTYRFVPDSKAKLANFVFRYRSKSSLQAEGIITRTPSPVPLEERPLEDMSLEELRELVRLHEARGAAASSVKREIKAEDIGGDSKTNMKHPQSGLEISNARPVKRQRISGPAEAIDLTDD